MDKNQFAIELAQARKESRYPLLKDFTKYVGISINTYKEYEKGRSLPSPKFLDIILDRSGIATDTAEVLRKLYNQEKAARAGVKLGPQSPVNINLENLSKKILRDIEYEIRRGHGVALSPRTQRACLHRIQMWLRNKLELE
jgi:transcriptional regulator with XRE-family HTH domain